MMRFTLKGLNKRRWELFKANRRGYWSLWIFGALFLMSVFAPDHCQRPANAGFLQG